MDRNKLRKIVLEELTGARRMSVRRRKLGLVDYLSESSEHHLLEINDDTIISTGVSLRRLFEQDEDEYTALGGDNAVVDALRPAEPKNGGVDDNEYAAGGADNNLQSITQPGTNPEPSQTNATTPAPGAVTPAPTTDAAAGAVQTDASTQQVSPDVDTDPDADANAAEGAAGGAGGVVQPIDNSGADPDLGIVTAPADDTDAIVDTVEDGGKVENPTPVATDDVSDDIADTSAEDEGTPDPQPVDNEAEGPVLTNRQVADIHKAAIRNFKLPPESTNESFHNRSLIELLYGR